MFMVNGGLAVFTSVRAYNRRGKPRSCRRRRTSRLIDFTIAATMRTTTSNTIIVPMFCESQVSITISPFGLDNS